MNKALKCGIVAFLIFLVFSITVYITTSEKNNINDNEVDMVSINNGVTINIQESIEKGKWYEITEEDKITLAFSSETSIISKVKNYLKDNKIAIFFIYGGPFDSKLKGNYIICTGFNEDGKAKILYPDDDFETEWTYSYEGLIEFANKVMLFDM